MSDLDHIEKVSAKKRFAVFLMAPNASFGRCLHSFRASHQNHGVTSVAASVSTLLASLANVARDPINAQQEKGLWKAKFVIQSQTFVTQL